MAITEQKKADEQMMHLAEEHKAPISFSFDLNYLMKLLEST
jgi:hypothetical protein